MNIMPIVLAAVLASSIGTPGPSSQQPHYNAASTRIVVPDVRTTAIVTDGIFSEGEWDGAVHFPISENFEIYLLSNSGYLYVGFKLTGEVAAVANREWVETVSDVHIAMNGLEFNNLHLSAPCEGLNRFSPDLRVATFSCENIKDWQGSPMRGENKGDLRINGKEYKISFIKLPGPSFKFHGGLMAVNHTIRKSANYPRSAGLANADNWVELVVPAKR